MKKLIFKLIWDIICIIITCIIPIYALVLVTRITEDPLIDFGCLISLGWIIYGIDKYVIKIKNDLQSIKEEYEINKDMKY